MAKKKTTRETPTLCAIPGSEQVEPAATDASADRSERLSIPLTADGNAIDWERMRPGTRDKLKTLTGSAPAGVAGPEPVDPAVVGMIYGSLGMLMMSAARAKGYTAEQASVLVFTTEEKAALVEPTSKVLSKYTGALGRWQDEIMLTVMIGTVLTGKLSQLRKSATVIEMVKTDTEPDNDGAAS